MMFVWRLSLSEHSGAQRKEQRAMTREEVRQLIADVQKRQSELASVEVKAARGGTPRRLYEPLSVFANRTGGGVLLFGLDESSDFALVGVGDAHRLQEEIAHLAVSDVESPSPECYA